MTIDCSIVILVHNGIAHTRHCLDGILQASSLPRQLILIDNGSSEDTGTLFAAAGQRAAAAGIEFVSWRNDANLGCSAARNAGWERARSEYVVFMDNDAVVCTDDWLQLLAAQLADEPQLAILGPKLIYPWRPHPIQCAGVDINNRGRIRFRGRGAARDTPAFAQPCRVQALISACWMMRRALLPEIGGLDELFHPVQYEDLDLCLRANAAGYYCAYTPAVEIYHFEGSTTGAFGPLTYSRTIARNSGKFRQKWHQVLRTYPTDTEGFEWRSADEFGMTGVLDLSRQPSSMTPSKRKQLNDE